MDARAERSDAAEGRRQDAAALIVDDHPLFCEALSMALQTGLGLTRVHVANDVASGVSMLRDGLSVDVIALDLAMPGVAGIEGLLSLRAAAPSCPVLIVSAETDDRVVARSLAAGAMGFARKDARPEALIDAVRDILDGVIHTPPGYVPPEPDDPTAPSEADAASRVAELTPQQLRILGLLCEGRLNKQIAYELDIAETTVKAHITAILRKLGVQSRTQAVLTAQRAGCGVAR